MPHHPTPPVPPRIGSGGPDSPRIEPGAPASTHRSAGRYVGRFAPSPTGPLHAGSLVAALASWLDARASGHSGNRWLVRIEDLDLPRCVPGADHTILGQLAACGLVPDEPPVWQSTRTPLYERALQQLIDHGWAYRCGCSRKAIAAALAARGETPARHGELAYPGTCRDGLHGRAARAWRLRTDVIPPFFEQNWPSAPVKRSKFATFSGSNDALRWHDRRLGAQQQNVALTVGDFVLQRADGYFAYQLAVVVDDAAQGVTDVVRGEDLADNTPRQILLQRALALPTPRYLHTPLVRGANGEKLSKQNGAQALDTSDPLRALNQAAAVLGLTPATATVPAALATWVAQWHALYNREP
ncbi:MAG: tRNA glutamyl-Q(34) synthetase GluQRS [Betaproteobacteria bacterium HGW-Betaproteobacteria-3]|jgi:glutamyl-Q tRNA(Asp) synthetase|nr:MAG: tRNA glutamyl-Q(34) synthetase GluQRS [Betaproteobacteria bacterium HGW-Betaproteobacteria-3]